MFEDSNKPSALMVSRRALTPLLAGIAALSFLSGCMTLSATQGDCLNRYRAFPDQAACIDRSVADNHALRNDDLVKEYVMTADHLSRDVRAGKMSDNDARLHLTEKLNQIRERDIAEQAQQAELFSDHGPTIGGYTDCNRSPGRPACVTY